MIKGQRKTQDPCVRCFMHKTLCICALIPKIDIATRVVLIVHAKELKRTTNTGRLAMESLVNSQMLIRGQQHEPLDLSPILSENFESLLFYPSDDAIELSETIKLLNNKQSHQKPIQLLVPDGNWRQASKVSIRHPELKNIMRVKISAKNVSTQHLRKEHFSEGMSTIEAIAEALTIIEGTQIGEQLRQLYLAKLHATLKGRGVLQNAP